MHETTNSFSAHKISFHPNFFFAPFPLSLIFHAKLMKFIGCFTGQADKDVWWFCGACELLVRYLSCQIILFLGKRFSFLCFFHHLKWKFYLLRMCIGSNDKRNKRRKTRCWSLFSDFFISSEIFIDFWVRIFQYLYRSLGFMLYIFTTFCANLHRLLDKRIKNIQFSCNFFFLKISCLLKATAFISKRIHPLINIKSTTNTSYHPFNFCRKIMQDKLKYSRCLAKQSLCTQIIHLLFSCVTSRKEVRKCVIQIMNNDTFVYSIVSYVKENISVGRYV